MTTTYENLPPRQKSQRVINKTEKFVQYEQLKQQQHHHHHHHQQQQHHHQHQNNGEQYNTSNNFHHNGNNGNRHDENGEEYLHRDPNAYPGLNDIADAFELFPQELVRYFTLLKEIDAKCVYTVPFLKLYIKRFLVMDVKHPKRQLLLFKIRNLIKELMPTLEEKMHVASILVDCVLKNVSRIEDDYNEILNNDEIPESVRVGPLNHPLMIMETKLENTLKSAQSQRSESRREALAAKKLLNINAPNSHMEDELDSSTATTNATTTTTTTKKKRQMTGNSNNNQNHNATTTAAATAASSATTTTSSSSRKRKQVADEEMSRPSTPLVTTIVLTNTTLPSVQLIKSKKQHKPIVQQQQSTKDENFQEPVYCYCQQVSFGEMVGCDGDDCKREWFHLPCIGLTDPPKGKWYCNDCLAKIKRAKR